MRAVHKRANCILITLFLLIVGICNAFGMADSFSTSTALGESYPEIYADGGAFHEDVCTYEMISSRSMSAVQYVQRHVTSGRNLSHLLSNYLPETILALLGILYAADVLCARKPGSHAVILHYIHEKDGKK